MENFKTQQVSISKLHSNTGQISGLPQNPRFVRDEKFVKLVNSLRENPEMMQLREVIAYDNHGELVIICGNMRWRAAKEAGFKSVPCKILPLETDVEHLKAYTIKDNVSFGQNDWDLLNNEWNADELGSWGLDVPLWDGTAEKEEEAQENDDEEEEVSEDMQEDEDDNDEEIELPDIQDVLYDSDNDFEIPNLLLDMQAGKVELPLTPWGANSRLRKDVSTYHFYVDDYRFEKLWKDPTNLLASGCHAIVEPNCSCHDQTPIAYGLQLIYKKRWLSRYCQECGIKVYVDLNVAPKFIEYNKLGVPNGYNAFFTRGLICFENALYRDIEVAREISGLERPNLIVYGGGESIKKICQKEGLLYIQDFVNAKNSNNGKK